MQQILCYSRRRSICILKRHMHLIKIYAFYKKHMNFDEKHMHFDEKHIFAFRWKAYIYIWKKANGFQKIHHYELKISKSFYQNAYVFIIIPIYSSRNAHAFPQTRISKSFFLNRIKSAICAVHIRRSIVSQASQ